jgi:hypothetical protein
MADEPKFDQAKWNEAKWSAVEPERHGEAAQRRANGAKHSERVYHGGNRGAGDKD